MFSIFLTSSNSFEGQEKDEKVILLVRRHPFFIVIKSLFFIILALVPIFGIIIFSNFLLDNKSLILFCLLSTIWLMLLWSAYFYSLTMYSLDVWILTDRRIIDSTQRGFFSRVVSELHLSRIQDMSVNTTGLIQTIFKFGDLQIQTAGTEEKFKFIQIPNPESVKDEISKLVAINPNTRSQ